MGYLREIGTKKEILERIKREAKKRTVTLLFYDLGEHGCALLPNRLESLRPGEG